MKNYLELMASVLQTGTKREDRTGTSTLSIFGHQMRFDLAKGFPLVTTKYCHWPAIAHELLWFLTGETNTNYLTTRGVTIWDKWTDELGNLGPVYGAQWRSWPATNGKKIDQIQQTVKLLTTNPNSRRIIVSAWNVGELNSMALAPCHAFFQFYVASGKLSCQLYQRSCDVFLGLPFNIASYALLTNMLAQQAKLALGEFIWTGGDVHLYLNHTDQAKLQLSRQPRKLPTLKINNQPSSIFDYQFQNFELIDYHPADAIKAPIAV